MDANNLPQGDHSEQEPAGKCSPSADQPSLPAIMSPSRQSSSSILGRESQDSTLDAVSNVHPSSPATDTADRYQQGKGLLVHDYVDKDTKQSSYKKEISRSKDLNNLDRSAASAPEIQPPNANASDFSSRCTSDDVELHNFSSEDDMTDDEEIGLTAQDKRHRTRRRRKNTQLDQRVIGIGEASTPEKSKADRNVLRALLINALLIGSWYLFSLSISIVGNTRAPGQRLGISLMVDFSTTRGCSRPVISISTCLSLRHVCIWLFSLHLLRPSFSSFHASVHDMIAFPIPILTRPTIPPKALSTMIGP